LFTERGFLFGPFCWGGEVRSQGWSSFLTYLCKNTLCWGREVQESGVVWSLNVSLQGHIQSWESLLVIGLVAFWGIPWGPWLKKLHVPLQVVGLTVLSWGMGALAHFVFWFPRPNNFVSLTLVGDRDT
jgi:hypothetical protein